VTLAFLPSHRRNKFTAPAHCQTRDDPERTGAEEPQLAATNRLASQAHNGRAAATG